MRLSIAAASLALAAFAASAAADDVTTKAGSVYTGKIIAEDDASVTIDTPALGRLKISRADIAKVKKDAPAGGAASKPDAKGDAKSDSKTDAKTDAKSDGKTPAPEKKPPAPKPTAVSAMKQIEAEEAALSSGDRDERRRTSKIVRRTTPTTAPSATSTKPATDAAAPAVEEKASIGGGELAQVPAGSWVIVFQPPKPFEPAPAGLQLGRRIFAKIESIGAASAWLACPSGAETRRVAIRLSEVQRHFVTTPEATRVRMIEGIDQGAWLRLRLDDGAVVQGQLKSVKNGLVTIGADGKSAPLDVPDRRIVEIDGLVRSTSTRFALAEAAVGEPVAVTTWPDGAEVVGVLKARDENSITVESHDGAPNVFAVQGPIAEMRRVPAKWRVLASNLDLKNRVHAKSVEEFADARVERDVVGKVVAVTAYSLTLDTTDGPLVLPFESLIAFECGDYESVPTRPMKQSDRACGLPALPGEPAEKAKDVDPATGVSIVTDGTTVKHLFVTAPFTGEVFGIRIHDKLGDALDRTDLRFDATVVPHTADDTTRAAETTSNSLAGMRVTLVLDASATVSAIEIAAR